MDTVKFDEVFDAELERIEEIREAKIDAGYSNPNRDRLIGIALSGGGIRSASFNLGVLQAFANSGALSRIDYLSTVSGGGYIGSALTWFLSKVYARAGSTTEASARKLGTSPDDHPLGRRNAGAKPGAEPGNERIDHIRSLGNYLRPTRDLWSGSVTAIILRNVILAVLIWLVPVVFVLALLDQLGWWLHGYLTFPLDDGRYEHGFLGYLYLVSFMFCLFTLLSLGRTSKKQYGSVDDATRNSRYMRQLGRQIWAGKWLGAALFLAIIASLPQMLGAIAEAGGIVQTIGAILSGGGLIATVYGLIGGSGRPETRDLVLKCGVAVVGITLLLGAYGLALWVYDQATPLMENPTMGRLAGLFALLLLALVALIWGANVELNHLSLHRLYRDRLMEAFMPDPPRPPDDSTTPAAVKEDGQKCTAESTTRDWGTQWHPATGADSARLAEMCDEKSLGPYHLINTNAILVGSKYTTRRNRGGDSFLLSPLYVGSDSTEWAPTTEIYRGEPQQSNQPSPKDGLQLSTALAISGAAANPNSGAGGKGITRSAVISSLMMLLNIRLAYWIPNPAKKERSKHWWVKFADKFDFRRRGTKRATFAYPGIAAFGGLTHREDSGYLEISDGGHFENLGIYELVRRRVPLIVVCDAGQDSGFTFSDLANAIHRVHVDFGVTISFRSSQFNLDAVRPDPKREISVGEAQISAAERGWALAEIDYPDKPPRTGKRADRLAAWNGQKGCLVYLKPTMRAGLPAGVVGYRAENPEFPHQTTADQFFDEAQFEAYRELGYFTGRDFLRGYEQTARDSKGPTTDEYREPLRLVG